MYLKSGFVSSFLLHITQSEVAIKLMNNVMNTYGTRELSISHGSGSWLWDTEDNKYLAVINESNLNEVTIISKKTTKLGFFERLFHIFS